MTLQEFNNKLSKMPAAIRALPPRIGKQALLFTNQRFAAANWVDENTEPWKKRKTTKREKRAGRALLVDTGRLRRSARITKITSNSVTIGSDVPYAAVHNDGFNGTVNVKAHTRQRVIRKKVRGSFTGTANKRKSAQIEILKSEWKVKAYSRKVNMPRRRFMGHSAVLIKQIDRLVNAELMKAIK